MAPLSSILVCALLARPASAAGTYRADASLLIPWSAGAGSGPYDDPYTTTFYSGTKSLLYIAAKHGNGASGPTNPTIDGVLREFTPQAVVLEGVFFDAQHPQANYLSFAKKCKDSPDKECDEDAYLAAKVLDQGVEIVGGEPTDAEVLKALQDNKFTATDMAGYYALRVIAKVKPSGGRDAAEARVRELLSRKGQPWGTLTYDDFLAWYTQNSKGAPADPYAITTNDLEPGTQTWFRKINAVICDRREPAILKAVEDSINRYDRVIVIFGGSHLVAERAVWKAMLPGGEKDRKY